ncbi:MAG TPA: response regulator transcription factor [bacterium]|nr:response regulator transcription factor [bacterium]HPN93455.1 response regulator transcription factor [bacterium]
MIRVAIVDDHEIVRDGIRKILESQSDIVVVGMGGGGREAIELLNKETIDVMLLDLDMPDMDGLEVTKFAAHSCPQTKILILTMHDDEEYALRIMKAGAAGYALKASSAAELPNIVRNIAAGKIYTHPSIAEKVASRMYKNNSNKALSYLSDREFQIIKRLAEGHEQKEIADQLCISVSTVATHKKRLMEKLKLKNNSEIVQFALKNGLINS